MYHYEWDKSTRGYILTTQTGRFIANEIRPVFAEELTLTGMGKRFIYNKKETRPLMWGQKNTYLIADIDENGEPLGRKVAQLNGTQYGKPLSPDFFFEGKLKLTPVDVDTMIAKNAPIMDIVVADAKRRTKELYDNDIKKCDIAYIAFSGGKDSVALLDITHRVLPLSVPVIFSDTDMELPDTYTVWKEIKARYPEREFIAAKAENSAIDNWKLFAPPSRTIRWCCSVHKSTPALMFLKDKLHKSFLQVMAFVGVRGEESKSRSFYEDASDGAKNASQLNRMPILDWGSHELWLYIFANNLLINPAYRKGLTRVGCLMCPESTEKYERFVNKAYPSLIKPYEDIIIKSSSKQFKNESDKSAYIGEGKWQARKSGIVLSEHIVKPSEIDDDVIETFQSPHSTVTFQSPHFIVTFQSPHFKEALFFEWIKTVGSVYKARGIKNQYYLKLPNMLGKGIPFSYIANCKTEDTISFVFDTIDDKNEMLPILRSLMRKVSACISCRVCESECRFGAIKIKDKALKISASKCTQCRKCYDICGGNCWRYMSMRYEGNQNNILIGLNSYANFGLREDFVVALIDMNDNFFPWNDEHPLGKKMVPSAGAWFPQAALIESKTRHSRPLADLFKKYGSNYALGWDIIWISLVNNAVLMKWFITSTDIDKPYTSEDLSNSLSEKYPSISDSAKKCGISSMKDMLTKSPLSGYDAVTELEMKGKQVKAVTRKAKDVNALTILYGLYLIAELADRSSFTVRELMSADTDSVYISPIVAFGISPETFKKQCEGLKSKYPDFIETTFTHGNDELTIFPQKHNTDDVIKIALGE
jgi:3'-phosphoadenosine 5'-phosphosulfate sulfotransferase (PAPS reductase)/FAD synthetase/ferredoxin